MSLRRRGLLWATAGGMATKATGGDALAGRSIGVALGSGAMHGWAHIGVVRAFERLGLTPAAIAGSSAGAFVGALWAGGLSAAAIADVGRELKWGSAGHWTLTSRGLKRNDAVREMVDRALGGRPIERLGIRFAALASDARTGESVRLERGPAGRAVAASSAVPVWFEPIRIDGRDLLDGSLTAPVPVDAARSLGVQVVVAVDVAYRPYEQAPRGLTDLAFQSVHILTNALAREQTQRADHTLRLDLHHLMSGGLDPDALIDAGESALMAIAPLIRQK